MANVERLQGVVEFRWCGKLGTAISAANGYTTADPGATGRGWWHSLDLVVVTVSRYPPNITNNMPYTSRSP